MTADERLAAAPEPESRDELIDAVLNGVSIYGRPLTDYMEPGLITALRAAAHPQDPPETEREQTNG